MQRPTYLRSSAGQHGAVTLLMSLIILLMITIMTMISAELYVNEQNVAANQTRERQSLEAAMLGMERALAFIEFAGKDLDGNDSPDYVLDSNGDGFIDMIVNPSSPTTITVRTDPDDASSTQLTVGHYAVEICNLTAALPASPTANCTPAAAGASRVLVYARGWSDDRAGIRHIVAVTEGTPGLASGPNNPLTTKGAAIVNGAGTIINAEGRSTIWSGQSVDLTNSPNNFKTTIQHPSGTGTIDSSSNAHMGVDVIENDGNLSVLTGDEFFANFFGSVPSVYRDAYATLVIPAANLTSYDGTNGEIIWVEGNASPSSNATYGTTANPVIMIIDGNFSPSGSMSITGLLYVTGDMTGNGTVNVNGAVVVQGTSNTSGNLSVAFSSDVIGNLGGSGASTVAPGSWKDWKEW